MKNLKQRTVQSEDGFFANNEKEVTKMICKVLGYVFCIFPIMLLLNVVGLFEFSDKVIVLVSVVGILCTLSPLVFSIFIKNQTFLKYYVMLCIITTVSVLGTEYYIGIYITYIIAPIVSCMYFDKKFTSKIIVISYLAFLVSYYFRSFQIRDHLYPDETIWPTYLPLAAGFTIEFFVSFLFLYKLADRTHTFLVMQKSMIDDMEKKEMTTQLAMEATKDIFFEYNVKNDTYSSNGTIRGWKRQDIFLEHFMDYVKHMKWRTKDFPETLMKIVNMPESGGNNFSEDVDISFMEGAHEYISWACFEISIIRDEEGNPKVILGKLRDITEQKIEEIKAEEAKNYDALSGMYNYPSLRKIVKGLEAKIKNKTHQIMIVHIRNYHDIAECYGEVYRDFVLVGVAEAIKKAIPDDGVYTCRLSKDVFTLYIPDCDRVDSRKMRQKINENLKEIYVGEKEENQLLYDFGYYLGEEEIDELFKFASQYISTDENVSAEEIEESQEMNTIFRINDERYDELSDAHKFDAAKKFIGNLSSIIARVKDRRSAIQMSIGHVGRFFGLSGVRIYEFNNHEEALLPSFMWTIDKEVEKDYRECLLSYPVRAFFIENFDKSRIVDNTSGAFQDFFRQFGKNPLVLEKYSSVICPVLDEGECCAIIVYDIAKNIAEWNDEIKEFLIHLSKSIGGNLMIYMADNVNKSRDVLLADISHEIRTSMNIIVGMTEMARGELNDKEQLLQCLESIDNSVSQLVTTVDNISEMS